MSHDPVPPAPIRCGPRLGAADGAHFIVEHARRKDTLDLTTCACKVARVINGFRYDTQNADLIASRSFVNLTQDFSLRQVYRGHDNRWFRLQVNWFFESKRCNDDLIVPVQYHCVLGELRKLVRDGDCLELLRDWYCGGWLPRNDLFVQQWAEAVLSADDCQSLLSRFDAIPDAPNR